jgi:hypothetical protein
MPSPRKKKCSAAKQHFKSHIAKGHSSNVEITESLVVYWFHIINSAAFKNALPTPDKIVVRRLKGAWGLCVGSSRTNNCVITISPKIETKSFLLATIAHEMVHQYQWIYRQDINHGRVFKDWKEFFRKNFSITI